MTASRWFVHATALVIVLTISGYATVSKHMGSSGLRLGAINAEALVGGEGGQVGNQQLGRLSTIVKPISVPSAAPIPHQPVPYTVAEGEDLKAVAGRFGLSVEQVRWSNTSLSSSEKVSPGDKLNIPPVAGVVVTVKAGDTLGSVADAYHVEPIAIADFNYLRDLTLSEGMTLVIPGGRGPEFVQPYVAPRFIAPVPKASSGPAPSQSTGSSASTSTQGGPNGTFTNGRFPWGYCTWYVATRRNVTWLGNAWEWYGNAAAAGMPVGSSPKAGAIMVTRESGWGHVAYVESVNGDGSYLVSEMNFVGFGIKSQRTIKPGQVPLIGFIY